MAGVDTLGSNLLHASLCSFKGLLCLGQLVVCGQYFLLQFLVLRFGLGAHDGVVGL